MSATMNKRKCVAQNMSSTPVVKRRRYHSRVSFNREPSIFTIEVAKSSIMTESEKRNAWYRPNELVAIRGEALLLCQTAIQTMLGTDISLDALLPLLPPIDFTPVNREEFRGLERYLNFERQQRKSTVKKAVLNLQRLLRENQTTISTVGSYDELSALLLADKTSDYTAWARNVALQIGINDCGAAYTSARSELNFAKDSIHNPIPAFDFSLVT
mmetsp:Transcript_7738/g.11267  ORF Transcript_7738/g.11267 Transcript_7738/m.11267 type:complete len:214 (-) Transcript_7738:92-733(-)